MNKQKVRIYGAGGCGTNIVLSLIKQLGSHETDEIQLCCIDTGIANVHRSGLEVSKFMEVITDEDGNILHGSGSIRASNYAHIKAKMPNVIHRFAPSDLNIIICSGAGGSGSTIAPVLIDQLIQMQQTVVLIYVDSGSNLVHVTNTMNTLKSLNNIAVKNNVALPVVWQDNSRGGEAAVDNNILGIIPVLSMVVSGEVVALDVIDVRNFFNYMRFDLLAGFGAGLAMLDVTDSAGIKKTNDQLVSVLTLTTREIPGDIQGVECPHQTIGILEPDALSSSAVYPIHLAQYSSSHFGKTIADKSAKLEAFKKEQQLRAGANAIKNSTAGAQDDGMVL